MMTTLHFSLPTPPILLPPVLGDAALTYAQAKLPVFPLRPHEKVPLVKGGFHAATTHEQQVRAWWKRWPEANIGIPTGTASGWIALDIDPRNGGEFSFQALRKWAAPERVDLLATCCQRSGDRGLHLLFAFDEELGASFPHVSKLRGYAGIDLKGPGGYLVVAPSVHPNGERYQWLRTAPLAPFPAQLLDLAHAPPLVSLDMIPVRQSQAKCAARDPGSWVELALSRSREGTRHHMALFLACRLAEAGIPTSEAEQFMCLYAHLAPAGTHPFPEREALACLQWARSNVIPGTPCSSRTFTLQPIRPLAG